VTGAACCDDDDDEPVEVEPVDVEPDEPLDRVALFVPVDFFLLAPSAAGATTAALLFLPSAGS